MGDYSNRARRGTLDDRSSSPLPILHMRFLALTLSALAAVFALPSSTQDEGAFVLHAPRPADNGVLGPLAEWEKHECAGCHLEITREWASTLHALAWEDEHYQKDIKKVKRKKSCYGCHIPQPLHGIAGFIPNPDPREEELVHGIDCAACHEGEDGEMLGPFGAENDAHPSAKNASFTSEGANRLCIACHATNIGPVIGIAKGFNETEVAKAGGSCIGCHMAPVERAHAKDPETGAPSQVRKGRSHSLQTPRDPSFLRQAFQISARSRGESTILSISNRTGHRVPGLTERSLEFKLELFDEQGKSQAKSRHIIDKRRYLPVDEHLEIELEGSGASVRVIGDHDAPGYRRAVRFLDETFEVAKVSD